MSFVHLLHAEWTKLRTVRGWVIGLLIAAVLTVLIGMLGPLGSQIACNSSTGKCQDDGPPLRPNGLAVLDDMTFVNRTLTGDGSITARITSFNGQYHASGAGEADRADLVSGLQSWSKAGVIIKNGTTAASDYAAVLVTGDHGVRMQYNYEHDTAGLPGPVSADEPRWLRLTRQGDTITGYDSADGTAWTEIGTAKLDNLPRSVDIGLFAASPEYDVIKNSLGGSSISGGPSTATGAFDDVDVQGTLGDWTVPPMGRHDEGPAPGPVTGAEREGDKFTVTGSGDIAPVIASEGAGKTIESALAGTFAGLIAVIVVAAGFMTSEYRRGLIRTSFAASPGRGRVLAAKALVLGGAAFATGLVASAVAVPTVTALTRSKGLYVFHASTAAEIRVIVGTAVLLAIAAVFAVAVGAIVRRGSGAVATVIVVIVLPYILAIASILPAGAAQWITRLTPAAAFAIQQTVTPWPQVTASYTPSNGYFPLSPLVGLAVLAAYAAAAMALALRLLKRRDA